MEKEQEEKSTVTEVEVSVQELEIPKITIPEGETLESLGMHADPVGEKGPAGDPGAVPSKSTKRTKATVEETPKEEVKASLPKKSSTPRETKFIIGDEVKVPAKRGLDTFEVVGIETIVVYTLKNKYFTEAMVPEKLIEFANPQ